MLASPRTTFCHTYKGPNIAKMEAFQNKCEFHVTKIAMEAKERLRHRGIILIDVCLAAHNRAEDDLGLRVAYQRWMVPLVASIFKQEGFAATRVMSCRMCRTNIAFTSKEHMGDVMHFLEELKEKVHPEANAKGEHEFTTTQFRRLNLLFVSEMERATNPTDNPPIPLHPALDHIKGPMKYDYSKPPASYRVEKFYSPKATSVIQSVRVVPEGWPYSFHNL